MSRHDALNYLLQQLAHQDWGRTTGKKALTARAHHMQRVFEQYLELSLTLKLQAGVPCTCPAPGPDNAFVLPAAGSYDWPGEGKDPSYLLFLLQEMHPNVPWETRFLPPTCMLGIVDEAAEFPKMLQSLAQEVVPGL